MNAGPNRGGQRVGTRRLVWHSIELRAGSPDRRHARHDPSATAALRRVGGVGGTKEGLPPPSPPTIPHKLGK
jgi:hypothetical protein